MKKKNVSEQIYLKKKKKKKMEFLFKNWFQNTNLSIHIAQFSASESLRVYTNIYKNSPLFASR